MNLDVRSRHHHYHHNHHPHRHDQHNHHHRTVILITIVVVGVLYMASNNIITKTTTDPFSDNRHHRHRKFQGAWIWLELAAQADDPLTTANWGPHVCEGSLSKCTCLILRHVLRPMFISAKLQ